MYNDAFQILFMMLFAALSAVILLISVIVQANSKSKTGAKAWMFYALSSLVLNGIGIEVLNNYGRKYDDYAGIMLLGVILIPILIACLYYTRTKQTEAELKVFLEELPVKKDTDSV